MVGVQKSSQGRDVVIITSNSCIGLIREYDKYINMQSCYGRLVFCESPICRFVVSNSGYALVFTWYESSCDWRNTRLPKYNMSTLGLARRTLVGVDVREFRHDFGSVYGILLDGMSEEDLYDTLSKTLKQRSDFIADLGEFAKEQHCSWYLNRLPMSSNKGKGFCIYPECLGQSGVFEDYVQVLGKSVRLI